MSGWYVVGMDGVGIICAVEWSEDVSNTRIQNPQMCALKYICGQLTRPIRPCTIRCTAAWNGRRGVGP
jgi:hypothetical protein